MRPHQRNFCMEPTSAGFGGGAAVKVALAYGAPAALAAILGLLIMPPKTSRSSPCARSARWRARSFRASAGGRRPYVEAQPDGSHDLACPAWCRR